MIGRILRFFRSPTFIMGFLGGSIFLICFYSQYADIDPAKYSYRDDGVITLSHAKNWVDHGHIGVDPSGKRLEGFSAPTQFWIYAVVYRLTGLHWIDFANGQTILATFLLGFFWIQFFGKRYFAGLCWTLLGAIWMTWHYRFIEWHGSGMENAWTHALWLVGVYCLWQMLRDRRIRWWWVLWLSLGVLTRTESVFHLAPVLGIFAVAFWARHRSFRGLHFALAVGLAWAAYQGWRIYYFGSFLPNTGLAQEINVRENLQRLWTGDPAHLSLAGAWAREILRVHGTWFLGLLLIALPFLKHRERWEWPLLVTLSLTLTAALNPFIFGMTRLDIARSTTFLVPFVALALALSLSQLSLKRQNWVMLPVLLAAILVGRLLRPMYLEPMRHLCCAVDNFREKAAEADHFAEANDLHRLQFANPDLGKLSYLKKFNLTDLGFLGSPVLARIRHDDALVRTWFYEFVRPDIIEVHGEWCVLHGRLLSDRRFREIYETVRETRAGYLDELGGSYPAIGEGIFVRKDLKQGSQAAEKRLISELKQNLSLARIKEELNKAARAGQPAAHQYVVRTAYRFLPEFEEVGQGDELAELFAKTPSAPVDLALLESGWRGGWSDEIVEWLGQNRKAIGAAPLEDGYGEPGTLLWERDRWRIYRLSGQRIVWACLDPQPGELDAEFILHVFAADKASALKKNPWGADFMDFRWDADCAKEWNGEYFLEIALPEEALEAIIVGQRDGQRELWRERIPWPATPG